MPEVTVEVPIEKENRIMAEATAQFGSLHDQNMAGMGQALTRFQNDVVTVSKAADYHYLQDMGLVSLSEAVGVREVSSRVNPAGPTPAVAAEK